MLMLLFVSVMLKKCQFINFFSPKMAQNYFINFDYHSFFTVLSQKYASLGILCIVISCFSQSKLSCHVFFIVC